MNTVSIHNAQNVTRHDKNWQSSVFAGPKMEESKRKKLNFNDKGRDGLFGDTMEKDAYERKVNLAGEINQREQTRAPQFDESAAEQRRVRELYGNSAYDPNYRENNR